jgi:hypothetical protein
MKIGGLRLALWMGAGLLAWHLGDDLGRLGARMASSDDELEWVIREFQPEPGRLAEIRRVHGEYLLQHQTLLGALERESRQLAVVLDDSPGLTSEVRERMLMLEERRARSHEETMAYCLKVGGLLGPVAGARYLREMERVILGVQPRHHGADTGYVRFHDKTRE